MLLKENEQSLKVKELNLFIGLPLRLYMYTICICIMTKPVTLSNEAYEALKKIKRKDMSFSDVVLKLVEHSSNRQDQFRVIFVDTPLINNQAIEYYEKSGFVKVLGLS